MLSLLLTLALAQPTTPSGSCGPGKVCSARQFRAVSSSATVQQSCWANNINAVSLWRNSQYLEFRVSSTCGSGATAFPLYFDTTTLRVGIGSNYPLQLEGVSVPTSLSPPSTYAPAFMSDTTTKRMWRGNSSEWIEVGGAPHSVSERVQYLIVSDRTAGANAAAWAVAPRTGGANVTFTTAGTLSNATGPGTEPWTNYATTAVSGNQAHHSSAAWFAPGNRMTSRVGPGGVITSVRLFHGMSGTRPLTAGSATPTAHAAVFRFDTSAGDTNWMACTGAGVALTCTSTGVPVVASSDLNATLTIDCREASALGIPTACTFWVNNIPRVRVTTNLPSALMGHTHSVETLTAASRDFRFGSISVETR